MPEILVKPDVLMADAQTIRESAKRVQAAIDTVDAQIRALTIDKFSGQRADALRARYQSMYDTLESYSPMLLNFAAKLEQTASDFIAADKSRK